MVESQLHFYNLNFAFRQRLVSSVAERFVYTEKATGSKPVRVTTHLLFFSFYFRGHDGRTDGLRRSCGGKVL